MNETAIRSMYMLAFLYFFKMNNFQDMTDFQAFVKESLSQGQTENALKAINVFCDRVRLRTSFINGTLTVYVWVNNKKKK
jgi:hypothetical protein